MPTITVALTGASGFPYGIALITRLIEAKHRVWVLYSQAAQIIARQEMQLNFSSRPSEVCAWLTAHTGASENQLSVFGRKEWFAPMASGSNCADAMVICPCSMRTLAAVAHGIADTLIERAADVTIKEKRKLILVPRETPLSVIHLKNMLALAKLGVVIMPATPGFYTLPQTLDDIVNFVVSRILDQLDVENQLIPRWGTTHPKTLQ